MENFQNEHASLSEGPHISHHQHLLLKGESKSSHARQKKISDSLKRLGFTRPTDSTKIPVIAVLGSGGGLRAMISLLGCLAELSKQDLLDAITCICGTSGSTWCMSALYSNDNWSKCMKDMEKKILDNLTESSFDSYKCLTKLYQSHSDDTFSLTHLWAYLFVYGLTKDINENKLSSHRKACEEGKNPYPIYAAVEKSYSNKKEGTDPGAWFQYTPHLSGFPAYKCFVDTSLLGSKFIEGKVSKPIPESDLSYLHGLWGSALAKRDVIFQWLWDINSNCRGCRELDKLFSEDLFTIKNQMENQKAHHLILAIQGLLGTETDVPLTNGEEIKGALFSALNSVPDFCHSAILKCKSFIVLWYWKWGITNNFLFHSKEPWRAPDDLFDQQYLSLIDAGLLINSAYPLILPPYRKVDLILSFDFSDGDPFLTLKKTAEYCNKNNIPFFSTSEIEMQAEEIPSSSCYVFEKEDKEVPTVMHFPLFNKENCKDKVEEVRGKYPTIHLPYSKSDVEELLHLSKKNVEQNRDNILNHIKKL